MLEVNRSLPDHDLGTARGKIEIDANVDGVAKSTAEMAAMSAAISAVAVPAEKMGKALDEVEKSTAKMAKTLEQSQGILSKVAAEVTDMGKSLLDVFGITKRYEDIMAQSIPTMFRYGRQINQIRGHLNSLKSVSGAFGLLGTGIEAASRSLFGINKEMKNFPKWTSTILKLSGFVTAVGVGAAFMSGHLKKGGAALLAFAMKSDKVKNALMQVMHSYQLLSGGSGKLGKSLRFVENALKSTNREGRAWYRVVDKGLKGMAQMITGAALMTSGFKSLSKILKPLAGPKGLLIFGGIGLAMAAIQPLSSFILGLANAIGQLSGSLLILPGALVALGIAGGVAMVGIKGIGKAFAAAKLDGDAFDKAIKDLPEGMQNVARTAKGFRDELKAINEQIVHRMWNGFSANLKQLGANYLPLVSRGAADVADSLNTVMISFMRFMNTGMVMDAWRQMFSDSSRVVTNLGKGLQPILRIFTDLSVVGSGVFAELTGGVEKTTQKWADFMWQARETGKLRNWMEDGIQGFRDLYRAIRDTSVAVGTLFRGFGGDGEDALARMAKGAANFRRAMEGATGGGGSGFSDFVHGMERSTERMSGMIRVLVEGIGSIIPSITGLFSAFSDAFSSRFMSSIKTVLDLVARLFEILGQFEILTSIIGSVLGAAAAMKILLLIIGPLIAAMKVFFGALMVGGGLSKILGAAVIAMNRFTIQAGFMGTAATRLGVGMLALGSMLTGPVLAALSAVVIAFFAFKQSQEEHARAQSKIRDDYKESGDAALEFADAVMDANGKIDGEAIDKMAISVGKLRDAWSGAAKDDASGMDMTLDVVQDIGGSMFSWLPGVSDQWMGDTKTSEKLDDDALKYQNVIDVMNDLNMTDKELSYQLVSSDSTWAQFRQRVVDSGDGGKLAAEELDRLRGVVERVKDSADNIGPSTLAVKNGLDQISEASATAEDKLDGVINVLRGLGLIETSAHEASMALAEELDGVVQDAVNSVNKDKKIGLDLLGDDGFLKVNEENAQSLEGTLKDVREAWIRSVIEGNNADAEFAAMLPSLTAVANQYGFVGESVDALLARYGFLPEIVQTIVSVAGAEQATVDLRNMQLIMDTLVGQGPKEIPVSTEEAANAIDTLGFTISQWNPETKSMILNIPPGLGAETMAKIQAIIDGAAAITPLVAPPPVAPAPGDVKPLPPAEILPSVVPQPTPPAAGFTPMAGAPILPSQTPKPLPPLPSTIPAPIVETPISPPITPPPPLPPITLTFDPAAAEERMGAFQRRVEEVMNGARAAIENFAATVPGILDATAGAAYGSGERLGQGFADGIGSQANIDKVRAAAMKLAEAASEPLPRSPAKIGPFSGKGWTPYRGISLAEGFAQGIMTGTPLAQLASMNMAQAVADAMDSVRGQFQMPQTSFSANSFLPGQAQYYRDPEISDKELEKDRKERKADEAKQRREDARNAGQSAADSLPDAEEKLRSANERLAKAEESLVKAKESDGKNAAEGVSNAEKSLREARQAQIEAETDLNKARAAGAGYQSDGAQGGLVANKERTDYINAMNDIAKTYGLEMTSGVREGDPGHHGDGSAGDFSNGFANTDQMLAFAEFMNANFKPWIKELIYDDPRFAGKEIKDGNNVDSSFYDGAGDHTNHVHVAVNAAPEFSGAGQKAFSQPFGSAPKTAPAIDPTRTDLSQDEVASLIIAKGREMKMSDKQISSALATAMVERELQNKPGGPDTSTGVFQQQDFDEWTKGGTRDRMNVSDAATSYFEHLADVNPLLSAGQQAQKVQRSEFPDKYDARMAEADLLLARLDTGVTAGYKPQTSEDEDTLTRMRAADPALAEALRIANDPDSTDAQIVQALQSLDTSMAGMSESDAELIQAQKDAVMDDRGIKEYDPYEGALKTDMEKFEFAIKAAQDIWGMFSMLKSGFDNMKQLGELMIRGVSNTDDLHSVVDGFQGVASTIGEVASAVSSVAGMIGTIAATAGMAIPGIGQIGTVVGMLTGGIGSVNAIVDLVQDVAKAGGRMIGGGLSKLLGGENGALQGNVRTLLDFNDNTIKSWGDRNPTDRTVRDLPFTQDREHRDPNAAGGFRDLNVFQGQGGNPMDSMNAAMFAVKAHSTGVFAG